MIIIKKLLKPILSGIVSSLAYLLLGGMITALVPNPWFVRMIPANNLDYFYLYATSLLVGFYVAIHYYKKKRKNFCKKISVTGGVGGFLAFSCPICNKILVLLFGSTLLIRYYDPIRPLLGGLSIILLLLAIYWLLKS